MKKLMFMSLLVFSAAFPAGAKERAVAQQNNNPFASQTGSEGGGSFTSEDVVSSGTQINQVLCLGGSSPYPLGVTGNDITVRRVSNGGDIRYEVLKGTRFVGACNMVHLIGR